MRESVELAFVGNVALLGVSTYELGDQAVEVFFPKSALADIKVFLGLSPDKLKQLSALFDAPGPIVSYGAFVEKIRKDLDLSVDEARAVVRVGDFFLTATEQDVEGEVLLKDLRSFIEEAPAQEGALRQAIDEKQAALLEFVGPKPQRARASKIQYLKAGPHPSATSFRTVCDLRPLFDEDGKRIEGLIPTLFLQIKTEDQDREEETQVIHLSRDKLEELQRVLDRARSKFKAMDERYGRDFLGE